MPAFFDSLELVLDSLPHNAPVNMAVDEVLLKEARLPLLRFYRWERPSVSFGYFEEAAPVQAAHPEREPVRRWTGGGIVLHGEDQTFSLLVGRDDPFLALPTSESYRRIHQLIAGILQEAGIGAVVTPAQAPKISQACFENAAQFDLLVQSRKIVGGAQRRTRWGMLHQGSIQSLRLPGEFPARLGMGMAKKITSRDLAPGELAKASELAAAKYATREWLLRK